MTVKACLFMVTINKPEPEHRRVHMTLNFWMIVIVAVVLVVAKVLHYMSLLK